MKKEFCRRDFFRLMFLGGAGLFVSNCSSSEIEESKNTSDEKCTANDVYGQNRPKKRKTKQPEREAGFEIQRKVIKKGDWTSIKFDSFSEEEVSNIFANLPKDLYPYVQVSEKFAVENLPENHKNENKFNITCLPIMDDKLISNFRERIKSPKANFYYFTLINLGLNISIKIATFADISGNGPDIFFDDYVSFRFHPENGILEMKINNEGDDMFLKKAVNDNGDFLSA